MYTGDSDNKSSQHISLVYILQICEIYLKNNLCLLERSIER